MENELLIKIAKKQDEMHLRLLNLEKQPKNSLIELLTSEFLAQKPRLRTITVPIIAMNPQSQHQEFTKKLKELMGEYGVIALEGSIEK